MSSLPSKLRDQVLAAAKATPAPSKREVLQRSLLLAALGVTLSTVAFVAIGGVTLGARSPSFVALATAGWSAVAALATWSSAGRGGSMLGRATRALALVALLTTPGVYAWITGCTVASDAQSPAVGWGVNLGCLAATLVLSLGPSLSFSLVRRGSDPVHPRALGAALGAAAGAWGGVLIDLHCPVTHWVHVAFAHVLPIALFSGLGAIFGKRIFGVR